MQIVEFDNGKQEVRCHARGMHPLVINRRVTHCNDYDDERVASRYDMEKIAWTVSTDRHGKSIGFNPPKKRQDDD